MAELWLPPEERFAIWEPVGEQLRVIGWRPGPAGVAAVDLTEGLRVVVDHARPATLTEVVVDLDDGRLPDGVAVVLASVVGDGAVEVLAGLPRGRAVDRPVALPGGRAPSRRPGPASAAFGVVALGTDLGGDAHRPPLARAVALVEGALAALALHRPLGHDLARRGLGLLAGAGADDPELDGGVRASVRALLSDLGSALSDPMLAAAARRAAARFAEGRRSVSPATDVAVHLRTMAAPAAAPMAKAAGPARSTPSPPGRPVAVHGDHRAWAWLDTGNHVQITAGPSADGTWARVFRRHDRLLLGLAPVRDGRSLVVIPPNDPDDLLVDLTDQPATPRPAPTAAMVTAAVTAGRRAARLSRVDDPAADAAWSACARAWTELGDVQRANLAARHGRGDRDRWRSAPGDGAPSALVADRIG